MDDANDKTLKSVITDSSGNPLHLVSVRPSDGGDENNGFYVIARFASTGGLVFNGREFPASTLKSVQAVPSVNDVCQLMFKQGDTHSITASRERILVQVKAKHIIFSDDTTVYADDLKPELKQWLDEHCSGKWHFKQDVVDTRTPAQSPHGYTWGYLDLYEVEFSDNNDAFEFKLAWG